MAKNRRGRRRYTIPTPEQSMVIRKGGYDPYEWLVIYEGAEKMRIMHRETRKTEVLEL